MHDIRQKWHISPAMQITFLRPGFQWLHAQWNVVSGAVMHETTHSHADTTKSIWKIKTKNMNFIAFDIKIYANIILDPKLFYYV